MKMKPELIRLKKIWFKKIEINVIFRLTEFE